MARWILTYTVLSLFKNSSLSIFSTPSPSVFFRSFTMSGLGVVSRLGRLRSAQRPRWFIPSARGLASIKKPASLFDPLDNFSERHIGPDDAEASKMLQTIGYKTMDEFIDATVPPKIRVASNAISNDSIKAFSEAELNARAKALGDQNKVFKNFIGMGYHCAVVPPVILRNVREIPKAPPSPSHSHVPFRSSRIRLGIPSTLLTSQRSRKVRTMYFLLFLSR